MIAPDKIPDLTRFPRIVLYAYSKGVHGGYRLSIQKPKHVKPSHSKTMSGLEAMSILRKVKQGNKLQRTETFTNPENFGLEEIA